LDLAAYSAVIVSGGYDLRALVVEAGITCGRCGLGLCFKRHQVRRRRPIRDLESGRCHENVPIVRVRFCDGGTRSLQPASVWRGRSTVRSVLAAVDRVVGEGVEATLAWATRSDAEGEEPVSERTLRRWNRMLETRLLGDPAHWIAGRLGAPTLAAAPAELLKGAVRLLPTDLLAFRARFGRALIDSVRRPPCAPRSSSRRIPGRHTEASPPDPPSSYRPRGRWSPRAGREGRGPPAQDPSEEETP
jgi:hypothetical protein